MKRVIEDYIRDIIDAMDKGLGFIEGMDYQDFLNDDKTSYATIRAIEMIGESVKNIPKAIRDDYPDIPWRDMAGMRDKLIHGYFGVKMERVWETMRNEVPHPRPLFEKMLDDIG